MDLASGNVAQGDRSFGVLDISVHSMFARHLEVVGVDERIADGQVQVVVAEQLVAARSRVVLFVVDSLDSRTVGAHLVGVGEVGLGSHDLAIGLDEIVIGFVVTVT